MRKLPQCAALCILVWSTADSEFSKQEEFIIIIIIIITAIQFSPDGSSPYTSTDKTNNIHKRNNTKHSTNNTKHSTNNTKHSKYKYTYYQNTDT